ncbi:MAG: rane-bound lytic murein transglycosylase [Sulfurospirillum sp.]|jgi:membrane-bound lytic murein transglycosylase D|nr:rane-bound lytic murein transglycosylase [Sulfurospirillum sp.]
MFRIIFFIVLCYQGLFAFLSTQNNYQEQVRVLNSLDIDSTFLTDSVFISMKEDVNRYKTKHFLNVLENGHRFVPVLRKMIKEAGIPDAFLYLAMAESNFAPTAYSKARAVGLWQFMPFTAKKFGLTIDLYVDERRDPIKSTQAAITYLKYLHERFGKWYLAAIAYNCGEGRVSWAIKQAGTDDLATLLIKNKKYIPRESRLYIRKIMMMQHLATSTDFIVENDAGYLMNRGSTNTFTKVMVKGGTTLDEIAESIGVSKKEISSYNHHLRYGFTPPNDGEYHVYIPYDKQTLFHQNFDNSQTKGRFYVHVVNKGDSLYSIGKHYGISYKIIKDFNNLKNNVLSINDKLIIPVVKPKNRVYTIKKGDTIGEISQKYNVAINTILKINNKKDSIIVPGEKIVIPYTY